MKGGFNTSIIMSKNNKTKTIIFNGFEGIDTRKSHSGDKNIYDLVNFRITDEGALKRRNGYLCLNIITSDITCVWGGTLEGKYVCFYLSGRQLYQLIFPSLYSKYVGSVDEYKGTPKFFFYKNSMYLFTSSAFYSVSENSLTKTIGYIPYYGKNWGTTLPGEINEPLNILNGYGRIHYKVPKSFSTMLSTGRPINEIVSVYKNGVLMSPEEYSKDARYNAITVPGIAENDEIIATYSYDLEDERKVLFDCQSPEVFGGISNSRIFMWGGSQQSQMLSSISVSEEALKEVCDFFPDKPCSPLYFPEGCRFTVGEGRYPIKGIARHYDRLLIFTSGDTWMANSADAQSDNIPIMNINSHVGCTAPCATSTIGNDPITVWKNGIYRWTSDTDELNECNAYSISDGIAEKLSPMFFNNAVVFKTPDEKELWFYDPTEGSDVFVYNVKRNAWSIFRGIRATNFFNANGNVGFYTESAIFIFSDLIYTDSPEPNSKADINAHMVIKNINLCSSVPKKLCYFALDGESNEGQLCLYFKSNGLNMGSFFITQTQNHSQIFKRLYCARARAFDEIRLEALPTQSTQQCIDRLEIGIG